MPATQRFASAWSLAERIGTDLLLLFLSFCLALNVARFVKVPYANPYDISSPYAGDHFMPTNNFVLVLCTVMFTIGIFYGLRYLLRRWQTIARLGIVALVAGMIFTGIIAPDNSRFVNNIDVFHHGEQLSPARAAYDGKRPYSQIFFLHGAGEDVLLPEASFHVFGVSIGSYFFAEGLLQGASLLLFLYLLHRLIKQNWLFLLSIVWFASTFYASFFYVRDIFVWLALLAAYKLVVGRPEGKTRFVLLGLLGVLAGSSLFYSVDRGVFLLVLTALIGACVSFFEFETHSYRLAITTNWRHKIEQLAALAGGYLLPLLVGLILLGGHAFGQFLYMSFKAIPAFSGLMFYGPFPLFDASGWLTWLPLVVVILLLITLWKRRSWPLQFSKEHLFAVVLVIFGAVFLQAAVGMADAPHMAYATPALFLAVFYMGSIFLPELRANAARCLSTTWPLLLVLVIICTPGVLNLFRLPAINQVSPNFTRHFFKLPSVADEAWLPSDVRLLRDYIDSHSTPADGIFVLSSEPIYYYLTDRPNPSRFYISWFADPQPYTNELLSDLKKNPPKFIIYQTGNYYDRPQFIPMSERLPEVNQWILQNYPTDIHVTGSIIVKAK